jgi:hypothetical protein
MSFSLLRASSLELCFDRSDKHKKMVMVVGGEELRISLAGA